MGAIREDFLENKRNRNIDNNIFKNLIKYAGNRNLKKVVKKKGAYDVSEHKYIIQELK